MAKYKVRPGKRHGKNKQYGPGDVVELTEREAESLLDKLELVVEEEKKEPAKKEPEKSSSKSSGSKSK